MQLNNIPLSDRLIRLKETCHLSGLGKTTVYEKIRLGQFPRQVQIGLPGAKRGTARWALSVVNEWVDAQKTGQSWQSANRLTKAHSIFGCETSCKSAGSSNTIAAKEMV